MSEHSAYHHGEASLTSTIVGMAQNFIGSNNINLLYPAGQFGTRLMVRSPLASPLLLPPPSHVLMTQGGKDAASPRYIFTRLNKITRYLFREEDDALLSYKEDDGQSVEPDVS